MKNHILSMLWITLKNKRKEKSGVCGFFLSLNHLRDAYCQCPILISFTSISNRLIWRSHQHTDQSSMIVSVFSCLGQGSIKG